MGRVMVYLDHAATTPMHAAAVEAMTAVLGTVGNASSLHTSGRTARRRIEESRELIADKLGARPSEVIFTAGGTESDNLALKGIYWARRAAEPHRRRTAELVRADAHRRQPAGGEVHGQLPHRLNGVAVHRNAEFGGHRGQFGYR